VNVDPEFALNGFPRGLVHEAVAIRFHNDNCLGENSIEHRFGSKRWPRECVR
jgi:hypothetical protein